MTDFESVAPVKFSALDQQFMQLALVQAEHAARCGEVPVGAVLVHNEQVIAQGYNQSISTCDATAHAEICALRSAGVALTNYRLPKDTILYVTLEPCTMCVGALIHARVGHVIFATAEPKAGSLVSARQLFNSGYYNHAFTFAGGLLQSESQALLQQFFKQRRQAQR